MTPEESEIVHILVERARQLLKREERIGGSSRIQRRAWMKDEEFQDRLLKLREHGDKLHERWAGIDRVLSAELKEGDLTELGLAIEVFAHRAGRLLRLKRRLNQVAPSTNIKKADGRNLGRRMADLRWQIEDLHVPLGTAIGLAADAALTGSASPDDSSPPGEIAHLLTLGELEGVLDSVSGPLRGLAVSLAVMHDDLLRAQSEVFNILVGRFRVPLSKGRMSNYRSKQLAAHLIGVCEGFGLHPTRNRARSQGSGPHCAQDVVAHAIALLRKENSPPTTSAILHYAPCGAGTLEDLAAESNPRARRSPPLATSRVAGRLYGERVRAGFSWKT